MIEGELRQKRIEEELNNLAGAYRRVFNTEDGKKVLESLGKFCNNDNTSVCEQNPNALQTFFNEGKRRVFLRIQWFINKESK
jgi:hypothetical protein